MVTIPEVISGLGHLLRPRSTHEMHDTWRLADGQAIRVRAVRRDDAARVQELVKRLSLESRYHRFFHALQELPSDMLRRFTYSNPLRGLTMLATVMVDGEERAVGMLQSVANVEQRSAEFALVVDDDWQRKGIAARLLHDLACVAANVGLRRLHGEVMTENEAMLGLMVREGFTLEAHPEEEYLVQVVRELAAPETPCPILAAAGARTL